MGIEKENRGGFVSVGWILCAVCSVKSHDVKGKQAQRIFFFHRKTEIKIKHVYGVVDDYVRHDCSFTRERNCREKESMIRRNTRFVLGEWYLRAADAAEWLHGCGGVIACVDEVLISWVALAGENESRSFRDCVASIFKNGCWFFFGSWTINIIMDLFFSRTFLRGKK